ncbi:hypothetical protein Tco_0255177 [Tanacetum coccineum]
MNLETGSKTTTTAKLPILKQGEYDMWRLRIEQYFQVQDYALWDVIENGNSFKPGCSNNKQILRYINYTNSQYKDAKTLFAAIQTRFGGNEATKKTQKLFSEANMDLEEIDDRSLTVPVSIGLSYEDTRMFSRKLVLELSLSIGILSDTIGYDKSKWSVSTAHKLGFLCKNAEEI